MCFVQTPTQVPEPLPNGLCHYVVLSGYFHQSVNVTPVAVKRKKLMQPFTDITKVAEQIKGESTVERVKRES